MYEKCSWEDNSQGIYFEEVILQIPGHGASNAPWKSFDLEPREERELICVNSS